MTAPADSWLAQRGGTRAVLRRAAPLVGVAAFVVVLAVLFARTPDSGLPLDPRSSGRDGTRALVLILSELGAEVTIFDGRPGGEDVDTMLVLVDNLDDDAADAVRSFVRAGGTALVADYSGSLSPDLRPAGTANVGFVEPTLRRACAVPALAQVRRVRPGQSPLFVVPDGATGCFGRDEAAWLVLRTLGSGTLVTAGGPAFLSNALIGESDNAVLAAALLAPRPGTRVGIVAPGFAVAGANRPGLRDLIPDRVVAAAWQLLIAFAVVVAWRARRLGRPLREPQAVRLPGSELVMAVGNLYQRTGARARAAELLRQDLLAEVSRHLGAPPGLAPHVVADLAAERTGVDREEILDVLTAQSPGSDAALAAFAYRVETIRHGVVVQPPVSAGASRALQ